MSAYMVDREHVIYLVKAAVSRVGRQGSDAFRWFHNGAWHEARPGEAARAAEVGQMLWDANRRSIEERYPDTKADFDRAPGSIDCDYTITEDDIRSYVWDGFSPVQVIKACHCFRYQACEDKGWEASEACAFIEELKDNAENALPGYEEAEWGVPKPRICGVLAEAKRIVG